MNNHIFKIKLSVWALLGEFVLLFWSVGLSTYDWLWHILHQAQESWPYIICGKVTTGNNCLNQATGLHQKWLKCILFEKHWLIGHSWCVRFALFFVLVSISYWLASIRRGNRETLGINAVIVLGLGSIYVKKFHQIKHIYIQTIIKYLFVSCNQRLHQLSGCKNWAKILFDIVSNRFIFVHYVHNSYPVTNTTKDKLLVYHFNIRMSFKKSSYLRLQNK